MNKQQLIDKAIDDLGGVLPIKGGGDNLIMSNSENKAHGEGEYQMYEWIASDSSLVGRFWKDICTREEFNNRKKEREMEEFKPKVGEICEVTWAGNSTWNKCLVGDKLILARTGGGWAEIGYTETVEFRPIKSEREKVIDEAIEAGKKTHLSIVVRGGTKMLLGELYDTGMLKSSGNEKD